jgi:signal transduction histidine kinase
MNEDSMPLRNEPTVAPLHSIARLLHLGVVLLDANGKVTFASDQALDLLNAPVGSDAQVAVDRLLETIVRGAQRPLNELRDGWAYRVEPTDDDSVPLSVRFEAVAGEPARRLVVIADAEWANTYHSQMRFALHYQRMMTSNAAALHDLKAPLNVLQLHLELTRRKLATKSPTDVQDALASIGLMTQELGRLDRMLMELLGPDRTQPATPARRIELTRFARRFLELVRPLCQDRRIECILDACQNTRLLVNADPDRLKQSLLNIVVNAIDAMQRDGKLELRLSANATHASIEIADSGPGIPVDALERIWEMQYTTKSNGHGIGLFAVRAAVRELGGEIRVANRPNGGCVFTIELPLRP